VAFWNLLTSNQVVRSGGEFIDNLHKTMIGYAAIWADAEDMGEATREIFLAADPALPVNS